MQLLHAHFATQSALTAMLVSELTGVPFSFTAHAYDLFIANTGTPGEALANRIKVLVKHAAVVITISDFNKQYIIQNIGEELAYKIKVIHCGIDSERFVPVKRNHSDAMTLLCVGRFVEKKGHEFLLRAFEKIANALPNAKLRLVGDGPLKPAMMNLCRELDLEQRVYFLGAATSELVLMEMKRADIFVLHSITSADGDMEGIPVSLMEASATGLPVIATRHSGIPELVIEGVTGLLTDEKDIESLAGSIMNLAESVDLRERLGNAGKFYVARKYNLFIETAKLKIALASLPGVASGIPAFLHTDLEKADEELAYWRKRKICEGSFNNTHYKYFFTTHFGLDVSFYDGKKLRTLVVAPEEALNRLKKHKRALDLILLPTIIENLAQTNIQCNTFHLTLRQSHSRTIILMWYHLLIR